MWVYSLCLPLVILKERKGYLTLEPSSNNPFNHMFFQGLVYRRLKNSGALDPEDDTANAYMEIFKNFTKITEDSDGSTTLADITVPSYTISWIGKRTNSESDAGSLWAGWNDDSREMTPNFPVEQRWRNVINVIKKIAIPSNGTSAVYFSVGGRPESGFPCYIT